MSITNTPKPTTTLNNTAKPNTGLTWATITTTWASEPDIWLEVSQLVESIAKPTTTINNTPKPA